MTNPYVDMNEAELTQAGLALYAERDALIKPWMREEVNAEIDRFIAEHKDKDPWSVHHGLFIHMVEWFIDEMEFDLNAALQAQLHFTDQYAQKTFDAFPDHNWGAA